MEWLCPILIQSIHVLCKDVQIAVIVRVFPPAIHRHRGTYDKEY